MKKPFSDKLRNIQPYVPGEQPVTKNIIKLNTNESPYSPSPKVSNVLNEIDISKLRLYPSFKCNSLKEALCNSNGLEKEQIFLGNGSDEVLALCFMAFFCSDKPIAFPDITYSFYEVWSDLYEVPFETLPLDDSFRIETKEYCNKANKRGGIILANPNAPTGILLSLAEIEDIIENNPECIVIIDEAYIDFGGDSAISLINQYDNLVVVRTFSKSSSLAGIRVGYACANSDLISVLENVKNSFNSYTLNSITQLIAAESVKDTDYFNECISKICNTRERVVESLNDLGFETLDSKANFIFTTNKSFKAVDLFEYLKSENILVRYFNKPKIDNYLRITIGTDDEMDKFIKAVKTFCKA